MKHVLVDALLRRGADADPAVLEAGGEVVRYGELRARVRQAAHRLAEAGLRPGDRVALCGETSAHMLACYLGAMAAGGVAVPIPPAANKLERLLARSRARFLIEDDGAVQALPAAPASHEADDLASLMYTSGSTGEPRGVMVTGDNLLANTDQIAMALGLTASDRALLVLPWHYCYGASVIHTHLRVGGSVAIGPKLAFAEAVLDAIETQGATGLYGVPSTFAHLLARSSLAERALPSLRYVAQAGGKLPESALASLTELSCRPDVYVMYGQTEATARLSVLPPAQLRERFGSIGRGLPAGRLFPGEPAWPETRLEVVREDGAPAAPGEVGEIVARGPGITRGYDGDPDETARVVLPDGGLRTGDLGVADEAGYVAIRGREREFIKVAGVRVSAAEIEEVLSEHPQVAEAAVTATPDPITGEAVVAHVVLRAGGELTRAEIMAHCRRRLGAESVPRHVRWHDSLPRTPSGKLARAELAAAS